MIFINLPSGVERLKGVERYKCKPVPTIVAVIPVPLIASKLLLIPFKITSVVTASSALDAVGSGRTNAILALAVTST